MSLKIANVSASDAWGKVNPAALETGLGGREGAMIYLSKEWAKSGFEVTNFTNVDKSERHYEESGFHEYVPSQLASSTLANWPFDVVIAWECPSIFANEQIRANVKMKITEMQCADLQPTQVEPAVQFSDYIATLSEWHKGYLNSRGIGYETKDLVVFPNGIDITRYQLISKPPKKPWRFVYSSSPDRGLWHLLKCWPKIRELDQEAELVVTYGVQKWIDQVKWSHGRQAEMGVELERLMHQEGVVDFGKVGQRQLSKLQMSSVAWLYPLDSIAPTETGCITAIENMAAGNPVITTDCDCMEDEFSGTGVIISLPFDVDEFVSAVEFILTNETAYNTLQQQGFEFAQTRDWRKIARQWENFFLTNLN